MLKQSYLNVNYNLILLIPFKIDYILSVSAYGEISIF